MLHNAPLRMNDPLQYPSGLQVDDGFPKTKLQLTELDGMKDFRAVVYYSLISLHLSFSQ